MENIVKDIEQMAKSRNLPVESESINVDTKIRNGKLDSIKVSFYVGEIPVDVEWSDCVSLYDKDGEPLDIIALIAYELDGVYVESFYEGGYTHIIAISKKPYYDIEDLQMCEERDLTDDFFIGKYFEVYERLKERKEIEEESERRHMAYLRRTTDRAVLCNG